jgi:hypothetical protein
MLNVAMRWTSALVILSFGLGCTVTVVSEPPPRRVVVAQVPPPPPPQTVIVVETPPPPPPATEIVITEDDEVNYVVYREYFGCSEEEVVVLPHYRRYYALTDDDIYFIYFVARRSHIGFEAAFHSYYYDCGRSYDRLVVSYNVPRAAFFVQVGGVSVSSYPPVYQRTYGAYAGGNVNVSFSNTEFVALVQMRVAVDYQGHQPAAFFAKVSAGVPPGRVVVQSREQCGHGGVSAVGARVTVSAPHPWTMAPAQKEAWHARTKQSFVKSEATFTAAHKEQVQKVQNQPKTPAKGPATAEHTPGKGPEHEPGKGPAPAAGKAPEHEPGKAPEHEPGKAPATAEHTPGKAPEHEPGKAPAPAAGKTPEHEPGKAPVEKTGGKTPPAAEHTPPGKAPPKEPAEKEKQPPPGKNPPPPPQKKPGGKDDPKEEKKP